MKAARIGLFMAYESINPVLQEWANRRRIVILREDGSDRPFFYISSASAETFQVVIEPEQDGVVRIDAHLIETSNDEEVHYIWQVQVENLLRLLNLSIRAAELWFKR